MCLATPSKVIKIEHNKAVVESGNPASPAGRHTHQVNLDLLKDVKIGDYLLIHGELAIQKVPETEAKKIIKMIESHSSELSK